MDNCGWCGLNLHCVVDGEDSPTAEEYWNNELLYCIPKDGFVNGNDAPCGKFVDESEFSILNKDGEDVFII